MAAKAHIEPNSDQALCFWLGFILTGGWQAFLSLFTSGFLPLIQGGFSLFLYFLFVPFFFYGILGGLTGKAVGLVTCKITPASPRRWLWLSLLLPFVTFALSEIVMFHVLEMRGFCLSVYDPHSLLLLIFINTGGALSASLLTAFAMQVYELVVDAFRPPTIP
ncbi:MAG: hypothetical protein IPP57_12315 [Candidatus Obscuribacter sp.]|nr:hypothetical protein [Candidatus Obscuribacter sp.]MBK9619571.1 hypothetical protein [Candidatus Obscuribacter sp.]MBK9771592.1 hypothetical protein [Candidatus Obscuribacter sp.]